MGMPDTFADLPRDDRINRMAALAERVEEQPVLHRFSDNEVQQMERELVDLTLRRTALKHEFEKERERYNATDKPWKLRCEEVVESLQNKSTLVSKRVFLIADHDEGYMNTYDEDGELVSKRRLMPNEKQLRLA